ncbi:MAG: phosphonate C-P lyase system protein PhnH, partial [Leptolyngbya sp. SIO3F4]|nr:phosphonate C-P lyase system protein PhnH [Leptolyngbya sp. SIO3F4]
LSELTGGEPTKLKGPGILDEIEIKAPVESTFWQQWQMMTEDYPLGIDCWYFSKTQIIGLPRTSKLMTTSKEAQ